MGTLQEGEVVYVQGSAKKPYALKNIGGVLSCDCPGWKTYGGPIDKRTCKHLKKLLGEESEAKRCGSKAAAVAESKADKNVPPLLLAHSWDGVQDPTGWWISLKLDGNRCYWDGSEATSRLGNRIHLPDWYKQGLPKTPLDGELWTKRGDFHQSSGLCRRQDKGEYWRDIKFMAFDMPLSKEPFEVRYSYLQAIVAAANFGNLKYLVQTKCLSMAHMIKSLREEEALGGEGLMLRKPGSFYETGRSHTLLKVKSFLDGEARVLGYTPGKGKHKGTVGALSCELQSGAKFDVGTGLTDQQRRTPPPIGSIVTIHYKELTKDGIPREPTFHGVRHDVKWK